MRTNAELRIDPTKAKRERGRPKGSRYPIQEHIFLDQETANKLKQLADKAGLSKSAYIRQLIQMLGTEE